MPKHEKVSKYFVRFRLGTRSWKQRFEFVFEQEVGNETVISDFFISDFLIEFALEVLLPSSYSNATSYFNEESEMKFRSCIRGFNSPKEGYI